MYLHANILSPIDYFETKFIISFGDLQSVSGIPAHLVVQAKN